MTTKTTKRGRPYTEGEPLTRRSSLFFSDRQHAALLALAYNESERTGRTVTVAELIRRAAVDRYGL